MKAAFSSQSLLRILVCFGLILAVAGQGPAPVSAAATWIVTSTEDQGTGTLRTMITNAASGDTITFSEAVAGKIIKLSSTLTIEKDLTIDASALSEPITLGGQDSVQVISILSGYSVELSGLTIANGLASNGAGIFNEGSLTVTGSTFSDNYSMSGGGGIYNWNGVLTVNKSVFSGNYAVHGGAGINNKLGSLIVTETSFTNNKSDLYGGGISHFGGSMTVSGSTFSNNGATSSGGSIYSKSDASITNSVFTGNHTNHQGGGIAVIAGTLVVSGSTFTNNTSVDTGGGIEVDSGTLVVSGSTFSNNTAVGAGGGLDNRGGSLTVTNSTFSGNTTDSDGGGIYNYNGTLSVTNSTFFENHAVYDGGGLYNYLGTMTVTNSTLAKNDADSDGDNLYNDGTAHLELYNSILAYASVYDCYSAGSDVTAGNNLIINSYGCGTPGLSADPQLKSLADNGGPTQTFAFEATSPVLETANRSATNCPSTDQRGISRPASSCNLGAYEQAFPTATTEAVSGNHTTAVTLYGTVTANGRADVSFEYWLDEANKTTVTAQESPLTGTDVSSASVTLSGLLTGATYFYRVAATNSDGVIYGNTLSFSTSWTTYTGPVFKQY